MKPEHPQDIIFFGVGEYSQPPSVALNSFKEVLKKCKKSDHLRKQLWMEVILTSCQQKALDPQGIFDLFYWWFFFPPRNDWKTGHISFTMGQLFPMIFLSVDCLPDGSCAFKSRTQQGLWPVNNKVSTGIKHSTFHGILHYNFRSSKQNMGRTWATKSKTSIFQAGTYK